MPTKKKAVAMQINTDPRWEERNVPANKQFDLNVPSTSEELCDPVVESVAVSSPFMENNNPDKGSIHDIDLNKPPPPQTWMRESSELLVKENGLIIHEPNAGLVFDLNTSTKQASNSYMSLTKYTRAPNISPSKRKDCGTKLQENPTAKRRYVRRKRVNKTSVPPTEITGELTKEKMPASAQMSCTGSVNFDGNQSYAVQKNQIVHPGSEIGVYRTAKRKYARRRGVNKTSAPPAEVTRELTKENMPACVQVSCMGSVNFDGRLRYQSYAVQKNPIEQPGSEIGVYRTAKREYVRRKGVNKTTAPLTIVTGELTEEKMPDSAQVSCTRSLNFDERTTDQSYAVKENTSVHPSSQIVVVMQEMNVGLAFDLNTSMKQASNSYMSLPEDTLSPNTFPSRRKSSGIKLEENTTARRKYVRRKELNQTSAPPTEVTRESTKEMPGAVKMSCRRSLNFDIGTRDESSSGIENTTSLLSGKENGVLTIMDSPHTRHTCVHLPMVLSTLM